MSLSLFLVVLGGRSLKSNIEIHDVRWVLGESLEDTFPELRKQWIGKINGLHIDSYKRIKYVDGYKIEICKSDNINSNNTKRLILNESFFQQPYEIIFRSLSDSIKLMGKKYYSTRGKKLSKILSDIENNRLFKVTLGGCIIEKVNQTVIISKEY